MAINAFGSQRAVSRDDGAVGKHDRLVALITREPRMRVVKPKSRVHLMVERVRGKGRIRTVTPTAIVDAISHELTRMWILVA